MAEDAPAEPTVVALLTDFGDGSVYVGAMKGVIATIAPRASLIDVTHGVAPQAVDEAAFLLAAVAPDFPPRTIFVTVVDPGVGSARAIALVEAGGRRYLAPDNGVLTAVLDRAGPAGARAWRVTERRLFRAAVSATFHGRDIFAPVAARLAAGEIGPGDVGPELDPAALVRLGTAAGTGTGTGSGTKGDTSGRVVFVDRFGNLVTDVPAGASLPRRVEIAGAGAPVERAARTYAEAPPGEPFAYVGSFGTVEVGVPLGSASQALGAGRGRAVRVWFEEGALGR